MRSTLSLLCFTAAALAVPPEPQFRALTLDDKVQIGYGVAVADVDGDKAPDVLLADKKQFVWYRNPGKEKCADPAAWTKHLLAENLTEKDNVCLAAQDIDGDGKCEIAVGAEWNPGDTEKSGAVFYLIAPEDRTKPWEAVKFPSVEPTTHRMKWIKLEGNKWGLVVVPLHGRGNKNGEGVPVKVLLYHKPADPRAEWKSEVLNESMHMTHNFDVEDGTGIALAGREGISICVRESGGWKSMLVERFGPLVRLADAVFGPSGEIRVGNRGRLMATIEPMHGNRLVAHTIERSAKRTVLTEQLADGHALACGDLLGAGSDQIVVGWRGNPAKPRPVGIKLFTALDEKGEQWRESFVDNDGMACEDLVLADLNSDNKLDVIASGRATKNLKVYLNETPRP